MFELKKICKKYKNLDVLKDLDLKVEKGSVVAIIGPSGSGKSTLLRCINYLERPESGIISFPDMNIDYGEISKKDIQYLRTKTSMVFQNYNLFNNKTIIENIMEALLVKEKLKYGEAKEKAYKYLSDVGIENKAESYPATLSGGQKQRAGIARALATNSDIILFDEPTSALDPELTEGILNLIKELTNYSKTMLLVTHEMKFAETISDKVIFLYNGNIVEEGKAKDVFRNPSDLRLVKFLNTSYNK